MVPIVYGASREEFYQRAPPNSYIHVDDFENVEELAKYLQYLDKNDTAYATYFAWKEHGEILSGYFLDESVCCVVCGGPEESQQLFDTTSFDLIFFTGSSHVGRIVMQAASKNLTPVALASCLQEQLRPSPLLQLNISFIEALRDRIPDTDVLERTGNLSTYTMLRQMQLRWSGHLVRMDDERIPKRLFYQDVATASSCQGGQIRRYMDTLKSSLKRL
nr:unnamed protein product [Spirometra erinaceieuropaei]